MKANCGGLIRFTWRVNGDICLTSWVSEHTNHPVSDAIYHQDKDKIGVDQEELIETLMTSCSRAGQIKKSLYEKDGLVLTVDQVRYKMKQLAGPNRDQEMLNQLLKQVKEEGGSVHVMPDPDTGDVRVLTVTTAKMRAGYRGSNPGVVNIDTTFNFETAGYKLNAVLYHNPTTGKGEVVQFAIMADECDESYRFCFDSFKQQCVRDPPVIIIDKVNTKHIVLLNHI